MNNRNWTTLTGVFLLVILGSGTLIFSYNFIQGKNLAQPPEFDLSAYNELQWPTPTEFFNSLEGSVEDPEVDKQALIEKIADKVEATQIVEKPSFKLEPHRLYFSSHFKGQTARSTQVAIANFLTDFEALEVSEITDLLAVNCYQVSLPVEGRQALITKVLENEEIKSLEVSAEGAPIFDLCFKFNKYGNEVPDLIKEFPELKYTAESLEVGEYIAYIEYQNESPEAKTAIEKIKKEYSDVITVTD